MRICHVVDTLAWTGGVQEYVASLAQSQVALGHEVTVLCTGDPARHTEHLHPAARDLDLVWHSTRKVARRFTLPIGMIGSIRQQARTADVLHVHQPFFAGTWMALLSRGRIAVTCYLHPLDLERGRKHLRRATLKLLLRRADLAVCVSHSELELLSQLRRPCRSCVIWPGLSSVPSSNAPRRPLVLSVARLSADKGIDKLIPSCGVVAQSVPVAIVGQNVDPQRVEHLLAGSGLSRDSLRGSLSNAEVDELYATATVFVSTSLQESFGIAALKAIAAGCRPLLSDIPSHREIVTTLGLGDQCLFDPSISPRELAERLLAAVAAGPMPAAPLYLIPTWETNARASIEHYERALRPRHGQPSQR